MSPIQQMLLGAGAVATKTYVDDVFSTFLYEGVGSGYNDISVNNGIDLSGEGGLVWVKNRDDSKGHVLADTVRGATKTLYSNTNAAEVTYTNRVKSFSSTGFTVGKDDEVDYSGKSYSSWTFRKAPGFFDIVEFNTGSPASTNQRISHSLGCVPGFIVLKKLNSAEDWAVYHRGIGGNGYLKLNKTDAGAIGGITFFDPTATDFGFNAATWTGSNADFVAYLFAGGEEGYNSVEFDGTGDKLSIANHSDLQIGSSTYTMEFWVYKKADTPNDFDCWAAKGSNNNSTREFAIESMSDQTIDWYYATSGGSWSIVEDVSDGAISNNQWVHICAQKDSNGYFSFFVNGTRTYYSTTGGATLNTGGDAFCIGGFADANTNFESNIKISNFRFIKGTALYSSSFTPSTTPLTNVTNTKLLCCNGDLPTSSTVSPETITANGDTHTTGTSPFISPDAVFGESGSESVIKCGKYIGNGSNDGPEINLGFEPSFLMFKTTGTGDWYIHDSMRGWTDGVNNLLYPNLSNAEYANTSEIVTLTSTGFKINTSYSQYNSSGVEVVFLAIRRSDGYVGKPPELGTDVFAMNTGTSNSDVPTFVSGFPVDFAFNRAFASSENWWTQSRLTGTKYLIANSTSAEATSSSNEWDFNNGWYGSTSNHSNQLSWMWKRHAGFDVVTYTGNGTAGHSIPHSLSKSAEMIWVKKRSAAEKWMVGHKGLNGGSNPWGEFMSLNETNTEVNSVNFWNDTAPTATHFTLGSGNYGNTNNETFIAMLFASVSGISAVGSYNGSSSAQTITTGFAPRFLIIKQINASNPWLVVDTTRGWGSGNDNYLELNSSSAQGSFDMGAPTSTGFTLPVWSSFNSANNQYIYYAHA